MKKYQVEVRYCTEKESIGKKIGWVQSVNLENKSVVLGCYGCNVSESRDEMIELRKKVLRLTELDEIVKVIDTTVDIGTHIERTAITESFTVNLTEEE